MSPRKKKEKLPKKIDWLKLKDAVLKNLEKIQWHDCQQYEELRDHPYLLVMMDFVNGCLSVTCTKCGAFISMEKDEAAEQTGGK